ncbi:MAG: HAD-IA family hydrolase [Nanoarchaeota archaeon]|nr:HAD-IA family hydrolase [Nanoarchaeota archaeon]MBU4124055.1 HAD-IA family hydrolase [Nanoarchaeota archaeon]
MIKYILLDVHGVLTDGNERKRLLTHLRRKRGINYTLHNLIWQKYINDLDKKIKIPKDYIKIINNTFNTHFSIKEYYGMFLKQIKTNNILLKKMNNITDKKICIVSDTLPPISSGLNKVFGPDFKKYKKFYSFRFGATKAEGLLKQVLINLKAEPAECLLIDDSEKNIEVAIKTGINGIVFKTNKALFNELQKLDI